MGYIKICDIEDPRVSIYRSLKNKSLRRDGIFIAEGSRVAEHLLKSDVSILSCLTTKKCYDDFKGRLSVLAKAGAPIYIAPKDVVADIIGFDFHQGLMMAARLPKPQNLATIARQIRQPHLLVALDRINDPENVGLIARNAAAFGADCLIVDRSTHNPFYRRAVRVSMGTIFKLPVAHETDMASALKRLKKEYKTRIIVASPGAKNKHIDSVDLRGNICLVFGNEDRGISAPVWRIADELVQIRMSNRVNSLNVACASAIFLQRASAQRRAKAL